jgi:hypothetical protein
VRQSVSDTRVFKVTYEFGNLEFCNFRAVVQKGYKYSKGRVTKIEATNAEATEGWADVTDEFRPRNAEGPMGW